MASGVCPPSPRKEDGGTADCNGYREFPTHSGRNPSMDLPEKEDRAGSYSHDDFCACHHRGTFAGANAIGHQPIYGVARRTCAGSDPGRADGAVQVYAGLFGGSGGDMCRTPVSRRMGEGGKRSAGRIRRGAGGDERKDEGGGETGYAGMRGGGYAGRVCGEGEIIHTLRFQKALDFGNKFSSL